MAVAPASLIIGVDFDGTVVEHRYPEIGPDVPHAVEWLKQLTDAGARIILWTMRDTECLEEAVGWYERHGIPLWGVNKNPAQHWTTSPKAYCNVYVDDTAIGVPLVHPPSGRRAFVDWSLVGPMLMELHLRRQA